MSYLLIPSKSDKCSHSWQTALNLWNNIIKVFNNSNSAIKYYDEAIEVFRASYGNDHNHNTAVAIGNIGLVYKDLGKVKEAREYLNLGKKILKDLYGEDCPDYQYFNQQLPWYTLYP